LYTSLFTKITSIKCGIWFDVLQVYIAVLMVLLLAVYEAKMQ